MSHECPATGCTRASARRCCSAARTGHGAKPLRNAVWVTWADGAGEGTLAHCQAIRAAVGVVNRKLAEAGR